MMTEKLSYYERNKDEINLKKRDKFICDVCNGKYVRSGLSHHIKTQKHLTAVKFREEIEKLASKVKK